MDAFPSNFRFHLPNGRESLPSKLGLFFTFCIALILIIYGAFELKNMAEYDSSRIFSFNVPNHFNHEYQFDLDKHDGL